MGGSNLGKEILDEGILGGGGQLARCSDIQTCILRTTHALAILSDTSARDLRLQWMSACTK